MINDDVFKVPGGINALEIAKHFLTLKSDIIQFSNSLEHQLNKCIVKGKDSKHQKEREKIVECMPSYELHQNFTYFGQTSLVRKST